jgi:hypothetical protein
VAALDVDVSDYKAFAQKLKGAEKSVARSLRKRLREAGKPLADGVLKDGPEGMPSRGGLADWLRQSKGAISMTQTKLQIKLSRGGKHDLNAINRGRLRHPVYGNRKAWAGQEVPAGTYDAAFDKHGEQALPAVAQVLDDIMKEIQ